MAQRPLRRHSCEYCSRIFFSRSSLSRFCCVAHQVATWRKNNSTKTQAELEIEYELQEAQKTTGQEAA